MRLLRLYLQRFPVTLLIFWITVGFFGAEHWFGGGTDIYAQMRLGALRAERVVEHGESYRLIMPIFLHNGWVHLAFNMFAFLQLAALVEYLYGRLRLVGFYLLCGLGGSLASAAFNTGIVGSVGASGAIMGFAGLILGTVWMGEEPIRSWLRDVLGWRLLVICVGFTFAMGIGLSLVVPLVDNWGHLGGFLTGLLLAFATPDPTAEPQRTPIAVSGVMALAAVGSVAWMAVDGDEALETLDRDLAEVFRLRSSEMGDLGKATYLPQMLEFYDKADAADEGAEVYRDQIATITNVDVLLFLGVMTSTEERDQLTEDTLARVLYLAPDNANGLNGMAWHLVTRPDHSLRDPAKAEQLSRRSLEHIETTEPNPGDWLLQRLGVSADPQGRDSRAAYLDTLAESLRQLGRLDEALATQEEAVALAQEVDLSALEEMEERLAALRTEAGGS